MHFNDLFDHHLPGPCGSARGSTLGPGTGLRLTEKGVVWLVGVNYTNKVWFPGQGALTHSAHTVAPQSLSAPHLTYYHVRTWDRHPRLFPTEHLDQNISIRIKRGSRFNRPPTFDTYPMAGREAAR